MHGNVAEWCSDWYGPYQNGTVDDPAGPSEGEYRLIRGGSWYDVPRDCRAAAREKMAPNTRASKIGFRIVVEPD